MGVETVTSITITCDNPACPGNDLDPTSYEGWIQLTAQVTPPAPEGMMLTFPVSQQAIYCSPSCAATVEDALVAAEEEREAARVASTIQPEPDPEPTTTKTRAKK